MSDGNKNTSSQKENKKNIESVSKLFAQNKNDVIRVQNGQVIGEEGANHRDRLYTDLLTKFSNHYDNSKIQAKKQKTGFFVVVLIFFCLLLVSGIVLLYLSLFFDTRSSIAVVVGASIEIFGSFIAIPTIIAKHLFPEKIDNDVIEVVKLLVENDKNVRETKEKHNQN